LQPVEAPVDFAEAKFDGFPLVGGRRGTVSGGRFLNTGLAAFEFILEGMYDAGLAIELPFELLIFGHYPLVVRPLAVCFCGQLPEFYFQTF